MAFNGKEMVRSWHKFLQNNFNVFTKSAPNMHKTRKYEHIEVQKRFEEVDAARRKDRLGLAEYRKKLKKRLLEQQLAFLKQDHSMHVIGEQSQAELQAEFEKIKKEQEEKNAGLITNSQQQSVEVIKENVDQEEKVEKLELELQKLNKELESISETKKELEKVDSQLESLEAGHTLLTGLKKQIILNHILYIEFQSRHLQGMIVHPETVKAIETVHYHLEHNLPIRTELLLEVAPEFFTTELEQLGKIEREKMLERRFQFKMKEGSQIQVFGEEQFKKQKLDFQEQIVHDEEKMRIMVSNMADRFADKWSDHIDMKLAQGFISDEAVLENIMYKPPEKRTQEEQQIYDEMMEVVKAQEDFTAFIEHNQVRLEKKFKEINMPSFVENHPRLREAYIKKWNEMVANSFDISESIIVPEAPPTVSKLDKALEEQKKYDIKELIAQSQKDYQEKVGGDEPVRGQDRFYKDKSLVEKLNIVAEAMNQIPDELPAPKQTQQFSGYIGQNNMPQEQKITLNEFPKILYLNNGDPKKYNLTFWAQHFNIEPQKLRNVFNYVSYAVPEISNEKETGKIFRFIYE